jgi:hypothetical protein
MEKRKAKTWREDLRKGDGDCRHGREGAKRDRTGGTVERRQGKREGTMPMRGTGRRRKRAKGHPRLV